LYLTPTLSKGEGVEAGKLLFVVFPSLALPKGKATEAGELLFVEL
jgi:hypothetical protein